MAQNDRILEGVIYSKFDQKVGSKAIAWQPSDLKSDSIQQLLIKTILLIGAETNEDDANVTLKIEKIVHSVLGLEGFVIYFLLPMEEFANSYSYAFITVVFKPENADLMNSYKNTCEKKMQEVIGHIKELEQQNKETQIKQLINTFYFNLKEELNQYKNEIQQTEDSQFPTLKDEKKIDLGSIFKVIILGDPSVGKSSTIRRFIENKFQDYYLSTIGVQISRKKLEHENDSYTLSVWDLAGQIKFDLFRQKYYKGSRAFIIAYDVTNPISFENAERWINDFRAYAKDNIEFNTVGVLIGNKKDLEAERKVNEIDAKNKAEALGLAFFETSAKTGENVEKTFQKLLELVIKNS